MDRQGFATAMRFVVAIVVWLGFSFIQSAAQPLQVSYSQGEQAFDSLSVENRIKLQILLTTAGYWSAIPAERFSTRIFRAIQSWQSANGLIPDGVLTETSLQRLVAEARPLLTTWQMQERFHPGTMRKIWVPTGLLQVADPISSGMLYKDPLDRIRLQHSNFESADLASSYQHLLGRARVEGRSVVFSIIRPNFYAMNWRSPGGTEAYVRYHRYGSGSYGFSMFWDAARNSFHAERIAALVSASFSADMEGRPFANPFTLLQ
jgi:serine protease Do